MDRTETQKILAVIATVYPNFKVENKTMTVDAWQFMLSDYSYEDISIALKTFINTSGKAFAPSVAELISYSRKPMELATLDEVAAWNLVAKAIRNSAYNSEKEFNKLPPLVQRAVGSPAQLKEWGTDENYRESVTSSVFQNNYRTMVARAATEAAMPQEARLKLETLRNQTMNLLESRT